MGVPLSPSWTEPRATRETTIGHDFRGPAVLDRQSQGIGKIDEVYRGRGAEQRSTLDNTGACSSRKMKQALAKGVPPSTVQRRLRYLRRRLDLPDVLGAAVLRGRRWLLHPALERFNERPQDPARGDTAGGAAGPSTISSAEDQTESAPDPRYAVAPVWV
jgi:hypothetical protein